ncbi:MAG: permease [Pirellulales bacterium]|nr:permease [Pirellulales bacterium]
MLDNVANLVLTIGLLAGGFGFPASFAVRYMLPGTALGVLAGDLAFTWMVFRLARRSGRDDITAMPLGLDTPSTIGMVLFVLGPAFLDAQRRGLGSEDAARFAWHIGMAAIVASGVIKLICALAAGAIRQVIPRAGLLGSLTSIALVLISFLPLLDLAALPIVGIVSLTIILATLVGRVPLPGRVPGALAATMLGVVVFYLLRAAGWVPESHATEALKPELALLWPRPTLSWVGALEESLAYLPVVVPFALATVIGGIDCTESAAAAGDEYHTGTVIAVEGVATLIAGLCGGVIQTTPYIGHPAYKAMGGRALYTLAAALFVGGAGMFGYFAYLYLWIPKAAIFPILIFVGLEITAQSFHATPVRHFPAVALACVPALAYLVLIFADPLLAEAGKTVDTLNRPEFGVQLQTIRTLSGGFIITSLLWASTLAALIDQRLRAAGGFLAVASVATLFGVIHSPLAGSAMFVPWNLPQLPAAAAGQTPIDLAIAYGLSAALLLVWGQLRQATPHGAG